MNEILKTFIIAIDGPNSAGKSTLAKEIARRLKITYIDTGAMYRAMGYYFDLKGYSITEEEARIHMKEPKLEFEFNDGKTIVILDGENISEKIRTPEIAMKASDISKLENIRKYLVSLQRQMAKGKSVIMEGRDIGSVVFKDADVKIYLTADVMVRAKRRMEDYKKQGRDFTLECLISDINKRDEQDMNRKNSPLIKTDDAVLLDNTNLNFEETVKSALNIINKKINLV